MSTSHLTKLKRKATEFEQKKQFEKALSLYIQFVDEAGRDLDDADLQLYNRVGDLLTRQGSVTEALAYYEKAVDMYAERGFLNNAIALCNKILRQSPARIVVYYKLGKISASKGFKSDARKNFLEYADRMQKVGQRDEAFRALKEFADICPDQDDIRLMLADMLSRDSRSTEAVEQLEQLYTKLQAEGRDKEAMATMDRIRAIDPSAEPRTTGNVQAIKHNDLVFLDLGDATFTAARSDTPRDATPAAPVPTVEHLDARGVAALQGLDITFLPDEEDDAPAPLSIVVNAVEGFEATGTDDAASIEALLASLPDVEAIVDETVTAESGPTAAPDGLEIPENAEEGQQEIVVHVEGLSTAAVTLTGAHPALAPLLEDPPLSSAEFGHLHLEAHDEPADPATHDLALPSELPQLGAEDLNDLFRGEPVSLPLLDETPDAWVQAALEAPRDDFRMDHLLTPLYNLAIPAAAESELQWAEATPDPEAWLQDAIGPASADVPNAEELDALLGAGASGVDSSLRGGVDAASLLGDAIEPRAAHDDVADALAQLVAGASTDSAWGDDDSADPEAAAPRTDGASAKDALGSLVSEIPLEPTVSGESVPPVAITSGPPTLTDLPPEFDLSERIAAMNETALVLGDEGFRTLEEVSAGDASVAPVDETDSGAEVAGQDRPEGPALDTGSLRSRFTPALNDAESTSAAHGAFLEAAFSEERVELPLIDMENDSAESVEAPSFEADELPFDELMASAPSFESDERPAFDPAPLDLTPPPTTNEEWTSPEVLIDGEWRDENVGDLVSGEMFVVGERRPVDEPVAPGAAFDDLAAAMLYSPDERDGRRLPTPSAPGTFSVGPTPRHSLSFGGLEAQLRRRLELTPDDDALRRQFAEALLDIGDREAGLNELELVVQHHEMRGQLAEAGEVVDVILRVVPLSVRHHQKRVEYAARSGNRPRLVEAYTELGDALFRCGEPDKARVVYSRVIELSPSNERARFAIGMLSQHTGAPRSSDEIPSIDPGVFSGVPSFTMATLTPESIEGLRDGEAPRQGLPSVQGDSGDSQPDLDDEVDAAFGAPEAAVREVQRRTSELAAVESWASGQPAPVAPIEQATDDEFVNLGDWLRGEGSPRSTRMVAADVAPSGDEQADFAEMLRRFKAGVDENVDADDYASHYDLGVAYKEMGLVDEAIGQFQRALRGDTQRVRAYEALGQCFVEKGQFEVALTLLQRAADHGTTDELSLVGVLYLLAYASEQVGRSTDAVRYYQRVFAVDIGFRDVAARLAALERTPQ